MAYKKSLGRRLVPIIIILILAAARYYQQQQQPEKADFPTEEGEVYQVERVVDGDTLKLATSEPNRVRLIGIDTPETVKEGEDIQPYGPEASQFTKEFVAGGEVRLRFDKERTDQYDRILAYVFVGDKMLNEELCRAGLARFVFYEANNSSMNRRLREAEEEAKEARRGIWSGN